MKRAIVSHVSYLFVIVLIFFTVPCTAQTKAKRFSFDSYIGVVSLNSNDEICMQISNPNLKEGGRLKLVSLARPQTIIEALVLRKMAGMCRGTGFQEGFNYYSLRLINGHVDWPALALAVVNPASGFSIKKGLVAVDLDKDGRREYFRKCTSMEGVHLTIWSGQPLRGKRRWHYYYYLRYDVVPTCRKKDYMD